MRVPRPAADRMAIRPPAKRARSRMLRRPRPAPSFDARSNPCPLSAMCRRMSSPCLGKAHGRGVGVAVFDDVLQGLLRDAEEAERRRQSADADPSPCVETRSVRCSGTTRRGTGVRSPAQGRGSPGMAGGGRATAGGRRPRCRGRVPRDVPPLPRSPLAQPRRCRGGRCRCRAGPASGEVVMEVARDAPALRFLAGDQATGERLGLVHAGTERRFARAERMLGSASSLTARAMSADTTTACTTPSASTAIMASHPSETCACGPRSACTSSRPPMCSRSSKLMSGGVTDRSMTARRRRYSADRTCSSRSSRVAHWSQIVNGSGLVTS